MEFARDWHKVIIPIVYLEDIMDLWDLNPNNISLFALVLYRPYNFIYQYN